MKTPLLTFGMYEHEYYERMKIHMNTFAKYIYSTGTNYIVTCIGVSVTNKMGSSSDDWICRHFGYNFS
jgi:hypothetical protein